MKYKVLVCIVGFSFFCSSCLKKQPNRINYFISVSPTEEDLTIVSTIGTLTREVVKDIDGETRNSVLTEDFPFELSTISGDTVFVNTRTRYSAHHVLGHELELFGVKLFEKNDLVFDKFEFFKTPMSNLEFFLEADDGRLVNVLFEIDLEASIGIDAEGNYTFDPVFSSKKISR